MTDRDHIRGLDEEQIAARLRELPRPPAAWIEAASQLPALRQSLDGLVQRALNDSAERRRILADLEQALRDEGIESSPSAVAALRAAITPRG